MAGKRCSDGDIWKLLREIEVRLLSHRLLLIGSAPEILLRGSFMVHRRNRGHEAQSA